MLTRRREGLLYPVFHGAVPRGGTNSRALADQAAVSGSPCSLARKAGLSGPQIGSQQVHAELRILFEFCRAGIRFAFLHVVFGRTFINIKAGMPAAI